MAWTVVLEDENKKPISSLNVDFKSDIIFDEKIRKHFTLLKYLDPYGDTIFNNLQMNDLISDLEKLKDKDDNILIQKIITLAGICIDSRHTYLAFYGD